MLHPASPDDATAGISIGISFHIPVVPALMTPGPSHDVTYLEYHREVHAGAPLQVHCNSPRNSTYYILTQCMACMFIPFHNSVSADTQVAADSRICHSEFLSAANPRKNNRLTEFAAVFCPPKVC